MNKYRKSNKLKFVNEEFVNKKTKATYLSYFQQLGAFEDLYNKDFGEFTAKEIQTAIVCILTKSKKSFRSKMACYRRYHEWAQRVKLNNTGIDPMLFIQNNYIEEYVICDDEFYKSII